MTIREGSATAGLKVLFKRRSLFPGKKGGIGFQSPRPKLRSMGNIPIVMPGQPGFQVAREPNIPLSGVRLALQQIHIVHLEPSDPKLQQPKTSGNYPKLRIG